MIQTLDHVVLAVHDLDAAVAAYETILGRRCDARTAAGGATYAWFRLSNMALALAAHAGPGPAGDIVARYLNAAGEGLAAVAFAVSDAAKARDLASRRGLTMMPAMPLPSGRFDPITSPDTGAPVAVEATHGIQLVLVERESGGATTPAADRGSASGLDHVVIRSPNPDRAVALYGGRLGLDLRLDRTNPDWGSRLLFFRCGDLIVEVAHGLKDGISDDPDALWGLSWRTPDVDVAHARLTAAGIDVSELRVGRRPGTRVFTIRDRTARAPTLVLGVTAASR